jgi:hypothetical protein
MCKNGSNFADRGERHAAIARATVWSNNPMMPLSPISHAMSHDRDDQLIIDSRTLPIRGPPT